VNAGNSKGRGVGDGGGSQGLRWSEGTAGILGSRVNARFSEGLGVGDGMKVDCRGARGSSGSCVNAGSSDG
jgi:hypothetical protein